MPIAQAAREELVGFRGRLIGPEDAGYDEARKIYNAMIDRRPALIARCADADEVARVVGFARDSGLLLAVRGGGHNGAGLGTCDDGVVIDLSALKDIEVDPQARTVRVGTTSPSLRRAVVSVTSSSVVPVRISMPRPRNSRVANSASEGCTSGITRSRASTR